MSLLHNDAAHAKTMLSTSGKIIDDDEDCIDEEGVPSEQCTAEDVELESVSENTSSSVRNAPSGWKAPCLPESLIGYTASSDKRHDAPEEEDIDNTGGWNLFSF